MEPAIERALNRLVDRLVAERTIRSELVEGAFRSVRRDLFLPGVPLWRVYSDDAIPTKYRHLRPISSSSQPSIMAVMLEQLELERGHHVLEIGAGTGYNAALLSSITGPDGSVITLDVDLDTAIGARNHLAAAGFDRVTVLCADGRLGWAPGSPYDRIIATAGVSHVPPAWFQQLRDGGILVAPIGGAFGQRSIAYQKQSGQLVERSAVYCGFMLMRDADPGAVAAAATRLL